MDKKQLIEAQIRDAYERGCFTGTWLYAEQGEIISKGAVGYRDPEDKLPIREDSIFNIASVSKQFTASAVMLLRRRGLLALDDEITKFFPQLPLPDVTVRHLLSHTSGLPLYEEWTTKTALREHTIPDNDVILRFLCESGEPAEFTPGEKFSYCNTGFSLLAEIVEKVSGVPFEDFLAQEIFQPAGMSATLLCHPRKEGITLKNLAQALVLENGRYVLADGAAAHEYDVPLDGVHGKGNVRSNILDLFRWDRVLREGSLLTREEQAIMYMPFRLNNGSNSQYGFGWYTHNDPALGLHVYHSGSWTSYCSWYERFLDADRVMIYLRSREPMERHGFERFSENMKAIAGDQATTPVRTIEELTIRESDKSGWEALCGKYSHPESEWFFIDEITMKDGALYAHVFWRYIFHRCFDQLRLYPIGENQFAFKEWGGVLTFDNGVLSFQGETYRKL